MVLIRCYIDGRADEHEERHLRDAIKTINGAQSHFSFAEQIEHIDLPKGRTIAPENVEKILGGLTSVERLRVCVTPRRLSDNFFMRVGRTTSVISFADWERIFAPPSLRSYLTYSLARALLVFTVDLNWEMTLRCVHEPPMGCPADLSLHKPDIKLGMIAGVICPQCRATFLTYGARPEALDAIERVLKFVRAEAIGRPMLVETDRAFIVMRFTQDDENDKAYRLGIVPGLTSVGIKADRADISVKSSQLLEKVKRFIDRDRFVIAKVDENNLNVYFELGLAMGADKEVLLISESSLVLSLPSDLRSWECLTYTAGNYEELRDRVSKFFVDNYGFRTADDEKAKDE